MILGREERRRDKREIMEDSFSSLLSRQLTNEREEMISDVRERKRRENEWESENNTEGGEDYELDN